MFNDFLGAEHFPQVLQYRNGYSLRVYTAYSVENLSNFRILI